MKRSAASTHPAGKLWRPACAESPLEKSVPLRPFARDGISPAFVIPQQEFES